MLVAPLRFKSVLLDEMDRVINAARLGRPASMILKNNSITRPRHHPQAAGSQLRRGAH